MGSFKTWWGSVQKDSEFWWYTHKQKLSLKELKETPSGRQGSSLNSWSFAGIHESSCGKFTQMPNH